MSDLVSRLRGIVSPRRSVAEPPEGGASSPTPPGPRPPASGLRELTYEPETPSHRIVDVERVALSLGGVPMGEGKSTWVRIDRRYETDRRHGALKIEDCSCDRVDLLRLLDPSVAACAPPLLFFDVETTGLSGGAGTLAFLVGCAWFDAGALQVEQYLLTSYAAERALLAQFAERVGASGMLVSYNGRTFDAPLLEMRWQFHRTPAALERVPHADMLPAARRLWRTRDDNGGGEGCSLSTLEQALFGVRRVGDVPGFEIPARYFHFLRSGDAAPLEPVLEHNRIDLVSLAALTARALAMAEHGSVACRDGWERIALGRLFERAGDEGRAMACFEEAARDGRRDVRAEALARIASRLRRARRHAEAAEAWQQVLTLTGEDVEEGTRRRALARSAAEALAVHQEHRARDLEAARRLAQAALGLERTRSGEEALRYRLARLERKMSENVEENIKDKTKTIKAETGGPGALPGSAFIFDV